MLTPKQIRIFEAFLGRPYKELSYREIKEYSKEKSNSAIQNATAKFLTEDLVKKREVGNMIMYTLNLDNNTVFSYFGILINERLSAPVKNCVRMIKEELSGIQFVSIVIFGSYADGGQTKESDLDIALLVNSAEDKRNCELSVKSAGLKSVLTLDANVFTKDEMLQMLKDRNENLGKQIARKHMAIHNPAIFYSIMKEGIDNGFKVAY